MSTRRRRTSGPGGDVDEAARERLRSRLGATTLADEHRLRRDIDRARDAAALEHVAERLGVAERRFVDRVAARPDVTYPEDLPVSARRHDIADAIRDHQVVVVAGETGSGKTTQIPKICLELGRGARGTIGHTQPRRLAARTVAGRIAEELGVEYGGFVGSAIRFDDRTDPRTAVKLMTDGVLLAEIRRDRLLRAYDTIIIDEAHERSLNIDFLLGYLAEILPRRPDLKVVITSATIDPGRFARHFAAATGAEVPIVEVSGRTYPVEIRYRPLEREIDGTVVDVDPLDGLADAVGELLAEGDGDVLVFLSGEREIRDAEEVLRGRRFRGVEIFPLFSRLSSADQDKAFRRHSTRRVVLATNIAETSVTVPGIHYVVDTGVARISRYSTRTKVQRLPIEPVSQASANQRAGRAGRVADGICIRLYSEPDFAARPEFTDPEIQRTNLASVLLAMADLDLGAVEDFPFVDPPDAKAIRDGRAVLAELGAIADDARARPRLTDVGRAIARLPLDPRLARMLVAANERGVLDEVVVIVAGLTIQDPRERPEEAREQADALHRRFREPTSDFLGYLRLWSYLAERRNELSRSAFRRICRDEYLHWLRIREWEDLVGQLTRMCRDLGWTASGEATLAASDDEIHRSLLTGLLSSIGMRIEDSREFQGARGTRFRVFPGSDLARKPPAWLMAAELVETSRLWARDAAKIDPRWVEEAAGDLVKRSYSEPHWSAANSAAMAYERVTLFGLPVVEKRRVLLSRVDPELARELFVRHGIVEGQWRTENPVLVENAERVAAARELETRSRRHGMVADDETLVAFYLGALPEDVVSPRHFAGWWKKTGRHHPEALRVPEALLSRDADAPAASDFPSRWRQAEHTFDLEYVFDPTEDADGLAVRIPLPLLPAVAPSGFEWLVPGMRDELYTAMLRTLPKHLRRHVAPPAEFASLLAGDLAPRTAPLRVALAEALTARIGARVEPADFHPEQLPSHLRPAFVVVDGDRELARGGDLVALRARLEGLARDRAMETLVPDLGTHRRWTAETFGDLPTELAGEVDGVPVTAYPALRATGDEIRLVGCTSAAEQRTTQTATLVSLLAAGATTPAAILRGRAPGDRLALGQYPHGGVESLVHGAAVAAAAALVARRGGPVFTVDEYEDLTRAAAAEIPGVVARRVAATLPALRALADLRSQVADLDSETAAEILADVDDELGPGFLARTPDTRLGGLERHVRAAQARARIAAADPARHRRLTASVDAQRDRVEEAAAAVRARPGGARRLRDLRWIVAEYRVSVFAQELGTDQAVSPERIDRALRDALAPPRRG